MEEAGVDVDDFGDDNEDEESGESNENILEKGWAELETCNPPLYFMVDMTTVSSADRILVNVPREDERVLDRTEAALEAHQTVDHSFAELLMNNSTWKDEIVKMGQLRDKYVSTDSVLVDAMQMVFENRFRHLDFLFIWVQKRTPHMSSDAEAEGLRKLFEDNYERMEKSIPPIKDFASWIDCMNAVRIRYDTDDVIHNNKTKNDNNVTVVQEKTPVAYKKDEREEGVTLVSNSPPVAYKKNEREEGVTIGIGSNLPSLPGEEDNTTPTIPPFPTLPSPKKQRK